MAGTGGDNSSSPLSEVGPLALDVDVEEGAGVGWDESE
jgi:hypothetical protein